MIAYFLPSNIHLLDSSLFESQFEKAQKAGMSRWAARPDAPGSGGKVKSEKVDPSSSPMALPTGGSSRDRLRQTLAWVSASPGSRGGGRKLMAVRGRDRGGSDDEGKRRRVSCLESIRFYFSVLNCLIKKVRYYV